MSRFRTKSTCNALVVAAMILAVLARVPFADGLLLHDHGDHGIHSHTVALDYLSGGDLCAEWHHYHDGIHDEDRDDRNNDSDGGEYTESMLILVGVPATAIGIRCSSSAVIASIQHPSSTVLPRSMLPSDSTATAGFSPAPWPSAHPLRPAFTLDALLQSSHALLL